MLSGWCASGGREMLASLDRNADALIDQARERDGEGRRRAAAVVDGFLDHIVPRALTV